jgi:hypothetical protein
MAVIASKSESIDLLATLKQIAPDLAARRVDPGTVSGLIAGAALITDDFAPVDQYLMDM